MNFDSSTVYYFFSTSAQSVAAIVGLSATFAVLRYQGLTQVADRLIDEIFERIWSRSIEIYDLKLTEPDRRSFDQSVTNHERAVVLKPYFTGEAARASFERGLDEHHSAPEQSLIRQGKVETFEENEFKFSRYFNLVSNISELRDRVLIVIRFGLALVILAIFFLLVPESQGLKQISGYLIAGFVVGSVIFSVAIFRLASACFPDPLHGAKKS